MGRSRGNRQGEVEVDRIAVILLNKRIAPCFGFCDEVLFLEGLKGDRSPKFQELHAEDPWEVCRFLVERGVRKVVCNGIWSFHREWLRARGIEVLENEWGPLEEALRRIFA